MNPPALPMTVRIYLAVSQSLPRSGHLEAIWVDPPSPAGQVLITPVFSEATVGSTRAGGLRWSLLRPRAGVSQYLSTEWGSHSGSRRLSNLPKDTPLGNVGKAEDWNLGA